MDRECFCDVCARVKGPALVYTGGSCRSESLHLDLLGPRPQQLPSISHSSYFLDPIPSGETLRCLQTGINPYTLAIAQRYANVPGTRVATNETKPRFGTEEVDILEREFKKNSKPTTQTKCQLAKDMGVELAIINNWFQHRRAKRKQEKKQEAYEARVAQDNLEQKAWPSTSDFTDVNGDATENNMLPLEDSLAPLHSPEDRPRRDSAYDSQYPELAPASMKSVHGTAIAQATEEKHSQVSFSEKNNSLDMCKGLLDDHFYADDESRCASETHDFVSQLERTPSQKVEDNSSSSMTNTKHDKSEHEWRILSRIPPPVDIASRRRRTKSSLSGHADRAEKLILESPQPTPIRTKFFDNDGEKDFDIKHPPSLTAGSSLNSFISPPTPRSPRIPKFGLFTVPNSCWTETYPSFDESMNAWHFQAMNEDQHAQVKDEFIEKLRKPQKVYLCASSPPITYQFSHTTASNFLQYNHREHNVVYGSPPNDKSFEEEEAKRLEDRAEHVTPVKEETLCVLAVVEGKQFVNDTPDSPASTIFEEVIGNFERDCHSKMDEQSEDVLADDQIPSDKPETLNRVCGMPWNNGSTPSLNVQGDEKERVIRPILDPMQKDLVESIMDEFWIMFDQHWAARMTQCPGGSSPSEESKYQGTQANKVSSITPRQKRQRSEDEDSPDDDGKKKPRKRGGGLLSCSKFDDVARFACPFRKHNPQKYGIHSHRVCALTSWETIARVKEHLYRNHKAGPYCKRCWNVFENDELLDSHAVVPAASICEAIPGNPPEGITPKQIAELKSKAKPYANQKDTDRWKEIFRLLFPGESVPSPYWEPVQEHMPSSPNSLLLASYDDYMHRELPRLFRSRVEEVVHREMQPVEASLLANLEGLIRECQAQLSSGYRETSMMAKQSDVSSPQLGQAATPTSTPNAADGQSTMTSEKEQGSSSDFFDAVLRPPPPQEDDYFLNLSAADAQLLGSHIHTLSSSFSDSGYLSVPQCNCIEVCSCITSTIEFDNPEGGTAEPSSVDRPQRLEEQNVGIEGVDWQDWIENRE